MLRLAVIVVSAVAVLSGVGTAAAGGWTTSVPFTDQVASSPTAGGGYPDVAGAPVAGNCGPGSFNSNRSESWLTVQPGSENLVGSSKFFFDKWSTDYNFYLGAYELPNGSPAGNNQIQGYDCVSTGTQAMPPSWTNTTDPNLAFDTKGRVYQVTLPFNAYWTNLHPAGEIDASYSDDAGKSWVKGNGGKPLDSSGNQSAFTFGQVDDKQWVAVNDIGTSLYRDHVYAAWAVFNGFTVEVHVSVSRDRGQTFSKPATLTPPNQTGPATTFVIPSIDAAGNIYVAVTSFPACCTSPATIYVSKSSDDGQTWSAFGQVAQTAAVGSLPNTRFRDGITESFAASPTYPNHLYLAYEKWDGTQMDVATVQSTDGGLTWTPMGTGLANDNVDPAGSPTDQFQPTMAAGPNGAVAVAFYDRRLVCPTNDKAILAADQGQSNFCINTSLQAYKDTGSGAAPVGSNIRISQYTWDPEQPGQSVDGLPQYPCTAHTFPCPSGSGFIGDYFGLAISSTNIYALNVSTHYPSKVKADDGGPVYYQQQILATVPRTDFGTGY
jgi:hypothetical protein